MPKLVYDRWPGVSCPLGRSAVLADQTAKDLPTPDPGGDIGRVAGLPLRRLLLQPLVWTVAVIVPGVLCQDAPEQATDPEFLGSGFFDARDAVQVKYEMVRKVRVGGSPVTETAAFGYSRSAYYAAAAALESSGLEGWAGPARADASKLIEEILAWAEEQPCRRPHAAPGAWMSTPRGCGQPTRCSAARCAISTAAPRRRWSSASTVYKVMSWLARAVSRGGSAGRNCQRGSSRTRDACWAPAALRTGPAVSAAKQAVLTPRFWVQHYPGV